LNVDIAPLIVRFRPLLIVKAVNSLPLTLSESKVRLLLVVVSTGPRCALLKPEGNITSAPCRLFCIGAVHGPPLHFQLLTVLQLLLGPAPVQTTWSGLADNCKFHTNNSVVPTRSIVGEKFRRLCPKTVMIPPIRY